MHHKLTNSFDFAKNMSGQDVKRVQNVLRNLEIEKVVYTKC